MGAQGSQGSISFREETVWGEVDAGQFNGTNFTAEDMAFAIGNKISDNVRPDRQSADLVQVSAECSGGFKTEMQANNIDALLPGFLWDTDWVAPGTIANPVQVSAAAKTFTFNAADTHNILPGQFFTTLGAVETGNNGIHYASAVSGDVVTTLSTLVNETDAPITLKGDRIRNGVVKHSFSIERVNNDISQFFLYKGMVPNTLEMMIESGSPIGANLGFVGKNETLTQTTESSPAASALVTTPIMSAVSSVGEVSVDNVALTSCLLQKVSFTLDNQVEGKTGIGVLGFCNAEGKSIVLKGAITMYFNDETYYEKYLNSTSFGLGIIITDSLGNTYTVHLPYCKFDSAKANITGKDNDVTVEGTFVAILDPVLGYTLQLTRALV